MVNKPKMKGTMAESAVVSFLRTQGFPYAERLALQGGKDRGDITGIPGICIEVKNTQTYTLSSWLKEAMVEKENSGADFAFVAAKPRLIGVTRVGMWMAAMMLSEFKRLVRAAGNPLTWDHHLTTNAVNRDLTKNLLGLAGFKEASGAQFGVVTIRPPGVDDSDMWYAVTMLEDMSGLLRLAGYGRLPDEQHG
jgi:hypothetical protein